jgi:glycosyltransferase 2 family protein
VTTSRARRWLWALQATVTVAVLVLVGRALARNWAEFRSLKVTLDVQPGWLALAALVVFFTYALYIESWRRLLAGWGQRIPFRAAARAWCLANLGRYLPGKIWSVAGLVVLAERAGVHGGAAAASAFASQALILGAGAAVVAAATPRATSAVRLVAAVLVAVATVGALVWKPTANRLGRLLNSGTPLAPLHPSAVAAAASLMIGGWLTYGLAFWLLARGILPGAALPLTTAAGAFALGYLLGMLALFAPGGVGVRELVLVGLLTPHLGSGGAVAVSVGSRVLLTLTEAAAAGASLLLPSRSESTAGHP